MPLAYEEISKLKDKLAQEKLYLEEEIRSEMGFEQIIGNSPALRNVLELVETVAPSDSTVLLLGETGTGKELIARARQIDLLIGFGNGAWLRILQSVPIPFLFVPMTLAGYVGLSAEKTNSAAGMMNFMRNIGQSVGTSAVTTVLTRRDQFHLSILATYTASPRFHNAVQGLAVRLSHAGLSMKTAQHQALGRLYGMVLAQTAALSYVDAYWLLAVAGAAMFIASFFLKPNRPGSGGHVAIH